MRKFIGVLLGLFIIAVAAVLIGPSFVDWNNYKDEVTQRVKEMTGRDLAINGDIRIAVLPAPALVVSDISFANPDGAQSRHMVTLKSAEVRVALGPLIGGQVKVETVKLIEPVIHLEKLSDGTANWEFKAPGSPEAADKAASESGTAPASGASSAPAIALDNLSIEKATLIYRDSVAGVTERVENLSARIAAASLQGPMETAGSAVVRGIPLTFDLNVGEIIHGRTVPFTLRAGMAAGDVAAQVGGTLLNLAEAPRFKGNVKLEGKDLSAALAAAAKSGAAPALARGFRLGGEVQASATEVQVKGLELALGETRAAGDMRLEMGDTPSISTRLEIKTIDLDALLKAKPAAVPAKVKQAGASEDSAMQAAQAPAPATTPLRFELPKALDASAIVSVDAIGYRGDVIRDAVINAKLSGGLLTLNQISAQFPGGSDLAAAAKLHTPDGVPAFSAEVDSTVSDLRGVLRWLGVAPPAVPADRLRKMSVQAQMTGTPEQVQISSLDVRFDASRLTGGVTVALRDRLAFGANLILDRLNVDSYLPAPAKAAKPAASQGGASGGAAVTAAGAGASANPFAALAALTRFDANVKAHLKSIVYQANPIRDLVLDATLYNGEADIRRLSVGKFAGASASLKGKLLGLIGTPSVKDLQFETKVPDPARLARAVGTKLPPAAKGLGSVTAKGRIDGNLLRPSIKATAGLAGGVIGIDGRVSSLPGSDFVDARITLKHKDTVGLARRFGASYRPAGRIGGIDVGADVKASAKSMVIKNLRAALGKLSIRGQGGAIFSGPKPVITARIESGALVVDPFLPAQPKSKRRSTRAAGKSTASRSRAGSAPAANPFPSDPLDLSVLQTVDADVTFSAPVLAYDKVLIEQAQVAARIKDGVLSVPTLTGRLFEGKLGAVLEAASGRQNRISLKGGVDGVNMAQSLTAVTGEAMAQGRMKIDLDVAATGASVRDLVGALNGSAAVALTDVDVAKAGKGTMMSGLLGLLTSLNKLGGSNTNDRAQMTGSFQIAKGIAQTNDIKLASAYGNGAAGGEIDLPAWTIDIAGEMELAQSFITQLLRAKIRESRSAVPFAITGRLDEPNVKVDTGALLGAGIPIPGADALLNKAPKGVGNILRGILGGGSGGTATQPKTEPLPSPPPVSSGGQAPPSNAPPPRPSEQQQEQPAVNPEKLLKQLFKL